MIYTTVMGQYPHTGIYLMAVTEARESSGILISTNAEENFSSFQEEHFEQETLASSVWPKISEQLKDLLGDTIHAQWFATIRPITVTEDVLVLETPNRFSCLWINSHYRELVDLLLSLKEPKLNVFFISPEDQQSRTA